MNLNPRRRVAMAALACNTIATRPPQGQRAGAAFEAVPTRLAALLRRKAVGELNQ
ncbi:MAG: hypothetical protein U0984_07590 [Prosthecobacter sp.]|nr:hypothetical protein [Prosthecobacter sp.]